MSHNQSRPVVIVRQGRDASLRRRHPWVFSGAVADRRGTLKSGCLVDVQSHDGRVLGSGHWGTKGISVRMLSFERVGSEVELLAERLQAAVNLRASIGLVDNPHTTGYRLVHGEGDELPGLVIDLYGDTAVVQCHSAGMWRLRNELREAVSSHTKLGVQRIVFRLVESQVVDQSKAGDNDTGAEPEESTAAAVEEEEQLEGVSFKENGLTFLVDVAGGQKTGFFLDQRNARLRMKEYSQGRHVLNAFSYTGAFSVYAFAGGAETVTSVDASKPAMDLCRQNVVLNFAKAAHRSEVADCFSYLQEIPDTFDLIVLDPPAFAKHQRAVQRAVRGYESINTLALKRIRPGGILATFSCSQLVSRDLFRDAVLRAAVAAGRSVKIIEHFHQAPCHPVNLFHPEGEYLKGLAVYVT